MQTFLPMTEDDINNIHINTTPNSSVINVNVLNTSFRNIAQSLDNKRLFKQALEGWQILLNLLEIDPDGNNRTPKGWSSHPAVKMWRGSEVILANYVWHMIMEWKQRGFKTTLLEKLHKTIQIAVSRGLNYNSNIPSWMLDKQMLLNIAASHRLALLVKQYEWYKKFNWPEDPGTEPESYEYVWPVKGGKYDSDERTETALVTS